MYEQLSPVNIGPLPRTKNNFLKGKINPSFESRFYLFKSAVQINKSKNPYVNLPGYVTKFIKI